jgi:hypothetical protein
MMSLTTHQGLGALEQLVERQRRGDHALGHKLRGPVPLASAAAFVRLSAK